MTDALANLLLLPEEMAAADRAAAESGLSSFGLMEKAGTAVAAAALRHYPSALRFVVFCGPGNNGGDGYVAARALKEAGAEVAVFALGSPERLSGDAAEAHAAWNAPVHPLETYRPAEGDTVIDAIFGAGLARAVPSEVEAVIQAVSDAKLPVVAVDLPSGVNGGSGAVMGAAFAASRTVTFMTRKPGHLLMPGRSLVGALEVVDIGIPGRILRQVHGGRLAENRPSQWQQCLPTAVVETHKYKRGHLVVFSGSGNHTGAARMSALAGLRAGAGLVTIASPQSALAENAAHLTAVMLRPVEDGAALGDWLVDERLQSFVLGPGFGDLAKARDYVARLAERHLVLDADGITAFCKRPQALFDLFAEGPTRLILTPHEGEFARLFPDLAEDPKLDKVGRARAAAARANAAVIYKGADSVIAAPDGRALINANAPAWLATAGSGDVLAGMIGGLLAQGVPAFEAAAAGVWLHGRTGQGLGAGLTAEDLAAAVRPFMDDDREA